MVDTAGTTNKIVSMINIGFVLKINKDNKEKIIENGKEKINNPYILAEII